MFSSLAGLFKTKSPKDKYLETWESVKKAIQPSSGSQELILAVDSWFQKYSSLGPQLDSYASTTLSTPSQRDESTGMYMDIDKAYKNILEKEKRLRGTDNGPEVFRQFRKDFLYEMNAELGEKVSRIKSQAPKIPVPAYISPPQPPTLQQRLDAIKARAGGRRKTRSRKTLKRKHKYRR